MLVDEPERWTRGIRVPPSALKSVSRASGRAFQPTPESTIRLALPVPRWNVGLTWQFAAEDRSAFDSRNIQGEWIRVGS